MRKKLIYSGLLLLAAATAVFLSAGYVNRALGGGMTSDVPTVIVNRTVPSNGFAYVAINTSDAQTVIVSAALSAPVNVYLFNASGFGSWQQLVSAAGGSAGGLGSARGLYQSNSTFVFEQTQLLLPVNASKVLPGNQLYNSSIYVVIDNTEGSASSNAAVSARVMYLGLDEALMAEYRGQLGYPYGTAVGMGLASILLFLGGVTLVVYGVMKKEPQAARVAETLKNSEYASESYIDALYKDVDKRTKHRKNARRNRQPHM